jgi:hypothetical protein
VVRRGAGAHGLAIALFAFACLAGRGAGGGEPAPCTASAAFDVPQAVVGQQVGFGVRISRRGDVTALEWVEPMSFPGFRAQWLPDLAQPGEADANERHYEERRALFPQRAGTLSSAPARLRCSVGDRDHFVEVPQRQLRVDELPTAGRPDDFAGLIGPLAIELNVTPQPAHLGESIRVAVMLRGEGNLWLAEDPLEAIAGADIFRRRPRASLQAGPRLSVMRHFAYDLVPLRAGEIEIPAFRFAIFDPATRTFETARSEALKLVVEPATAATASERDATPARSAADGRARDADPAGPPAASRTQRRVIATAAASLLAVAGAIAIAFKRLRRTRHRAAAIEAALTDAASTGGTAAATARALRLALAPHLDAAAERTPDELLADPALPEQAKAAVLLLAAAERARFDPGATAPDRETVRAAITKL